MLLGSQQFLSSLISLFLFHSAFFPVCIHSILWGRCFSAPFLFLEPSASLDALISLPPRIVHPVEWRRWCDLIIQTTHYKLTLFKAAGFPSRSRRLPFSVGVPFSHGDTCARVCIYTCTTLRTPQSASSFSENSASAYQAIVTEGIKRKRNNEGGGSDWGISGHSICTVNYITTTR